MRPGFIINMTVYGCQLNILWEDKGKNFRKVRNLLDRKKLPAGSMVILPEMFATGFSMNAGKIAEGADGPTTKFMRELAREKDVYVVGGIVRTGSGTEIFNEAVCFSPSGKRVARYDKLHLFSPGGEAQHYTPGRNITLFRWGKMRVALFVCYDLRFPEIFRMAALQGAEVMAVIANWPSRRCVHWSALLQARAIENQAYVVGMNRCGRDPQLDYSGDSVVIGPWGETVASAGKMETVMSAELDWKAVRKARRDFDVLKDIRTDFTLKTRSNRA
jgi:omega-amidase